MPIQRFEMSRTDEIKENLLFSFRLPPKRRSHPISGKVKSGSYLQNSRLPSSFRPFFFFKENKNRRQTTQYTRIANKFFAFSNKKEGVIYHHTDAKLT